MGWTIQDYGAAGEFIGAIGVVVTLVYLAIQIRQNTRQLKQNELNAKTAAINATNTALREPRKAIFESAEMTEIFLLGNENPDQLDQVQSLRYRLVMQNIVDSMVEIHSQTFSTGLSEETWEAQGVSLVQRILGTNGGRQFWEVFSETYPLDFKAEVDRILSS